MVIATAKQQQKFRKARVALAMRDEYGKVPKEEDLGYTFRLVSMLHQALHGIHAIKRQHQKRGQLACF